MNKYKARSLMSGYKIGEISSGNKKFVAVPKKKLDDDVLVAYKDESMLVPYGAKGVREEEFEDKFGRGTYVLVYFEWEPKSKQVQFL